MSSILPRPELAAYAAERLATVRIALLWAFLFSLTWFAQPPRDAADSLARAVLLILLVVQLRLGDDLADREYDRLQYPERILPRASPGAFRLLTMALALPIAVLLPGTLALAGYAVLVVFLASVYAWSSLPRALRSTLVLLKYPAMIVLTLDSPDAHPTAVAAFAAYLAMNVHEWGGTMRERSPNASHPLPAPGPEMFEAQSCYACGSVSAAPLITAEEDLTGKPGRFHFVRCNSCGLAYQSPRLMMSHIGAYYDDEYIAHRKKQDWGWLTPLYRRAMDKHDRDKLALVQRYKTVDARSEVLDVGCAAGTFLAKVREACGARITGVDFKDLAGQPWLREAEFHCGLFYEQDFGGRRFDLITMWHFLEHDYDPPRTLRTAAGLLAPDGRLVIEVPRLDCLTWKLYRERWPGLQAPQHTVLFDRKSLLAMVQSAGLEVEAYLPYGAFPAYFYLFAGAAFKLLKGRGLNLDRAIVPYFAGQLILLPVLFFERRLNLAMQMVVCRRASETTP